MRPIQLLLFAFLFAMQFVPSVPQPGTVAGRIAVKAMPPQEVASRYPAAGGQVQRATLPVPAVVYIDGPVAGVPVWSEASKKVIVQKDLQFSPSLLVIPKNTTVSFPNEDREFHNVFSYSKSKRFDLGRYPKGESKDVIFDKPGIKFIQRLVASVMMTATIPILSPVLSAQTYSREQLKVSSKSGYFQLGLGGRMILEGFAPGRDASGLIVERGRFLSGRASSRGLPDTAKSGCAS